MDFIHVEGTQTERPLEFDATTSKTVVYIRKNIERKSKIQDGNTYEVWEYDEAQLPMSDFAAIASAIVSSNKTGVAGAEDAVCELSESTDESIAALEQAICDLSEEINK